MGITPMGGVTPIGYLFGVLQQLWPLVSLAVLVGTVVLLRKDWRWDTAALCLGAAINAAFQLVLRASGLGWFELVSGSPLLFLPQLGGILFAAGFVSYALRKDTVAPAPLP